MNLAKKTLMLSAITLASANAGAFELGTFNGTKFSFGGYIKTEGVFNSPENGDNTFNGTARQSRFNFTTQKEVNGHHVIGFIEGDFYGGNASGSTYDWRLRHAYVNIDDLTIGQSWSGQFLGTQMAETIDFLYGLRGTLGGAEIRQASVHYQFGGARVSFQDPVSDNSDMPDMTLGYKYRWDSGSSLGAVVSVRNLENDDTVAGGNINGKIKLGQDDLIFNLMYGEGLAAYTAIGTDLDAADDAISQFGYNLAYRHFWTPTLRSTVQYTKVEVDDAADTEYDSYHLNLVYNHWDNLEFGVEWRKYMWEPTSPRETQQVEVMARYFF